MTDFTLNGQSVSTRAPDDTPLLWVIRDELGLTGTKFGCGIAQCGVCTVHVEGRPVRSCSVPVSIVAGQSVTTIEGLAPLDAPHAVQRAWVELQVPQCGYCQSGQIMQAAALLAQIPNPTDDDITTAMTGNLCRCMTYPRIARAVRRAADLMNEEG